MMELKEIDELIKAVSKFPGLGPKSAKRIILKLINNKDSTIKPLAKSGWLVITIVKKFFFLTLKFHFLSLVIF